VRVSDPVANVDLAPTILELAEVTPLPILFERPIDGRSLAPYTYGRGDADRAVLIESKRPPRLTAAGTFVAPSWVGVRTRRYTYVEHYRAEVGSLEQGFGLPIGSGALTDMELYDLELDPQELRSRHADPAYTVTRAALAGALAQLRSCAGEDCQLDVSVPPPA
jgi:arylsulfatase A-like enzyme